MTLTERIITVITFGILACLAFACTDKRKPPPTRVPVEIQKNLPPETLLAVADFQYSDNKSNAVDTLVYHMSLKNNVLHLIGKPFGYMAIDIGGNPEAPTKIFAVAEQIDRLQRRWIVDQFASLGLAVVGRYAIMSGTAGASVMDIGETLRPKEVRRYPPYDPESDTNGKLDEAYIWNAIAVNPASSPLSVIGFRRNDYAVLAYLDSNGLVPQQKLAYANPGETVCCVEGATVFQSSVYVAFQSELRFYDFEASGVLTNERIFGGLQAMNVASTDRYLYVHHKPNQVNPEGIKFPEGIYVFDRGGKHVSFLQTPSPALRFLVSQNDSHLYANLDNTSVRIFRIEWQSRTR